jgi:hypothetical protein
MGTSHSRYPVRLEDQQRRILETMVRMSRTPAKHCLVARALLMSDQLQDALSGYYHNTAKNRTQSQ